MPPIVTPDELKELIARPSFVKRLRRWNNAFALASLGLDNREVAPPDDNNPFPGNIRIQGQIYHQVGNIVPPEGLQAVFLQRYFIDTEEALNCRRQQLGEEHLDEGVLRTLTDLLHRVNPYIKDIKTSLEVIRERSAMHGIEVPDGHIVISSDRRLLPPDAHRGAYNVPSTSEIAGIILGDEGVAQSRTGNVKLPDIVLHYRPNPARHLSKVNTTHRSYDPLLYVLLFPHGEDGWHPNLHRQHTRPGAVRIKMTELNFYSYRVQVIAAFTQTPKSTISTLTFLCLSPPLSIPGKAG